MGFLLFLKDFFSSLGVLAIPLFIALSVTCIVIIERVLFYSVVFRFRKVAVNIEDIILKNKAYPKQFREDLLEIELEHIYMSLNFGLNLLKFIAGVATMLGLLGTVLGMIDVFSSISSIKTAVSPAIISSGIKKAMFTTAYGLIVGIIALFTHYIFENMKERAFLKLEEYSVMLNANVEHEHISKKISKER